MERKLPTFEKDGYVLISGVASHNEAPTTFLIPSHEEKANVKRGSVVKLSFDIRVADSSDQGTINGERMWVIVGERDGDWFAGILDNQPTCTDKMQPGLIVTFKTEHIITINEMVLDLESDKYKEYRDALQKALATKLKDETVESTSSLQTT